MRKHLAFAVAQCVTFNTEDPQAPPMIAHNCRTFGRQPAGLKGMLDFLESTDPEVLRNTVMAFHKLSENRENALALQGSRVRLVELLSSDDVVLQDNAAHTLSNIRSFFLAAVADDKARADRVAACKPPATSQNNQRQPSVAQSGSSAGGERSGSMNRVKKTELVIQLPQ